ncbi:helix-turn-helix domain-containing protein [Candidatus Woesearchaeota archaeon]|nr:helix-turn-helix domain-containing protein [Candidatus Woesearchaeota archaeon]
MAKKESTFLLVSLEEEKAKKLANVISNQACRKILDYLSGRDATETEIANSLDIPISTVHYNIKLLSEAGLVRSSEFHYSPKGKEVNHYSLANKYIIIAPKGTEDLPSKLKKILPAFAIAAGVGLAIQLLNRPMETAQKQALREAATAAGEQAAYSASQPAAGQQIAFWIIAGAALALLVYIAIEFFRERFK